MFNPKPRKPGYSRFKLVLSSVKYKYFKNKKLKIIPVSMQYRDPLKILWGFDFFRAGHSIPNKFKCQRNFCFSHIKRS